MAKKQLFRKEALERLSSPEQLDQLMQVTTPKGWIALLAIDVILLCALLWGIFGSIPEKVQGAAILLHPKGLDVVASVGSGQLLELRVKAGDHVEEGQVVAILSQPELEEQMKMKRQQLAEMEANYQRISNLSGRTITMRGNYNDVMEAFYQSADAAAQRNLAWLEDKIGIQEQLLEQGLITRQDLMSTTQQRDAARQEIERIQNQIRELSLQEFDLEKQRDQELLTLEQNINNVRREIAGDEEQARLTQEVVSSHTGRIIEVYYTEGDIVQAGRSFMSVEPDGTHSGEMIAFVLIPVKDGKKVEPGMAAQVSPASASREKYGFIWGEVHRVGAYPVTAEGLEGLLHNQALAQALSGEGVPLMIEVVLNRDPLTASGYVWSSSAGPPFPITAGTMCEVMIVKGEEKPISMVVPMLKDYLGF